MKSKNPTIKINPLGITSKVNPLGITSKVNPLGIKKIKTKTASTDLENTPLSEHELCISPLKSSPVNISIEDQIKDIDINMKSISDTTGLKDHVEKYHNIFKKVNNCKTMLDSYKNNINNISTNIYQNANDIDDITFLQLTNELTALKETFSNEQNLDKLIEIYKLAKEQICICNTYITKQKMDVQILP
jgi:hypothetical protein